MVSSNKQKNKYALNVANLIFSYVHVGEKRVKKGGFVKKNAVFFFAASWQSPKNLFSASLGVNRVHKESLTDVRVWNCTKNQSRSDALH